MTHPNDGEYRTDWSTTSFSEMSTLAACEEKWRRRYVLREATESGPAANKGTLFHEGTGGLLTTGGDLQHAINVVGEMADEIFGDDRGQWSEVQAEVYTDAVWLVERYAKFYAVQLKQVKLVAQEIRVTRDLHYPTRDGWKSVTVKMDIDSLLDFNGQLWLREAKSSGKRDILEMADVSPQISLYWWGMSETEILAELGYPEGLYGVLFDYAYSYHWKPEKPTQASLIEQATDEDKAKWANDPSLTLAKARQEWARAQVAAHPGIERPLSESFEQKWIDRTPVQVEMALEWARNILDRRDTLVKAIPGVDRSSAIRNIGPSCTFCDHKRGCFGEMAFDQDDILLVEE